MYGVARRGLSSSSCRDLDPHGIYSLLFAVYSSRRWQIRWKQQQQTSTFVLSGSSSVRCTIRRKVWGSTPAHCSSIFLSLWFLISAFWSLLSDLWFLISDLCFICVFSVRSHKSFHRLASSYYYMYQNTSTANCFAARMHGSGTVSNW